VAPATRERPEAVVHKKGWFPVNELKSTECSDADRALIDSAYELLEDPRMAAFFTLAEPYYQRSHEISVRDLVAMQKTGAPLGPLSLACEALVRMTDAGGAMPNRASRFDMLELLFVLRSVARVEVVLAAKKMLALG
jgi:hypothetical protein